MENLKPYYRLSDFPDRKSVGKNWKAVCPDCGKQHLSINKNNGAYHCFTPGCNFNGKLDDYRSPENQHNQFGERMGDIGREASMQVKKRGIQSIRKGGPLPPIGSRFAPMPQQQAWNGSFSEEQDQEWQPEDYKPLSKEITSKLYKLSRNSTDSAQVVVREYLEAQKIDFDAAVRAGCMCAVKTCYKDNKAVVGPCLAYVNRIFGDIINVKYRLCTDKLFYQDGQNGTANADEDGRNKIPSAPYNIDCINPLCPRLGNEGYLTLIITEGEKDVLTLLSAGYETVISPPNGAQNKPEDFFQPFTSWLAQVKRVVICGDSDKAGRHMKKSLTSYFANLGIPTAVCQLSYGCKDISEVNQRYGLDEVRRIVDVEWPENPDIMRIGHDKQGILDVLEGIYDHGYSVGYGPYTDHHFLLTSEGGLIVVTGRPGSGKTDWTRCTMAHLMFKQDKRVCFLSFEEPNKRKQVRRIAQLAFGKFKTEDFNLVEKEELIDFLDDHMVNLQMIKKEPTPQNIISLCEELRSDQHFMMDYLCIDPYLFISPENTREAETQQIKEVLTTLQTWGRERHVWVIMVAHPRKLVKDGVGEYEEVDEYTISGSAHWANLADYLISVKRNFPCGTAIDGGIAPPSYTTVSVLKVRDQDLCHTGKIFYLRQNCGRYEECRDETECRDLLTSNHTFKDTARWLSCS